MYSNCNLHNKWNEINSHLNFYEMFMYFVNIKLTLLYIVQNIYTIYQIKVIYIKTFLLITEYYFTPSSMKTYIMTP